METSKGFDAWEGSYKSQIKHYIKANFPEFMFLATRLFAPGESFSYIINFHNYEIEYITGKVEKILGICPNNFAVQKMIELLPNQQRVLVEKKEACFADFACRHINSREVEHYKFSYFYKTTSADKKSVTMLHQGIPLRADEDGRPVHALSIHSKIDNIHFISYDHYSITHLEDKPSYLNLSCLEGKFDPASAFQPIKITDREKQILELAAKGNVSQVIANTLSISIQTVSTIRKNMFAKYGCKNMPELLTLAIMSGEISTSS